MENITCKTCGGDVYRNGNYYICEFCGNKWEIDASNDIHAVERANAWSALREGDFERAGQTFENILHKEPQNHEAYWGRALASAAIIYVTDLNENKKVPTCNNITEESFLSSKDVQKAISLAPSEVAGAYQTQAQQIEKIRQEWLQKASKEPAYDVFISYKDSDREHGIVRTQDSIDAQDLYNALVAEGYKVFFSRISLRDKISEQYEPYIYNAIKTAKVMIVFGEKAEYFNAVWLKNEWTRFKARIEKGEKHKNSLVTVYKNLDPADLPVVLKSRQCLNASEMTFLSDLLRHIRKVIELSQESARLERIKVEGGQVAKKATTLSVNSIQTRQIGAGGSAETDLSNQQLLSLTDTYLKAKQWDEAAKLVEEMLFENPTDAQAIWRQILLLGRNATEMEFCRNLSTFTQHTILEKMLNTATKDFAARILDMLYDTVDTAEDAAYARLLQVILPYSYPNRSKKLHFVTRAAIDRQLYESFQLQLGTVDPQDVDTYIAYNLDYARQTKLAFHKSQCAQRVLEVDEGNVEALRIRLYADLSLKRNTDLYISELESLLRYAPNPNMEVIRAVQTAMDSQDNAPFIRQAIRYYGGKLEELAPLLLELANRMLQYRLYDEATYYCNLILSFDKNNADVYWTICRVKSQAIDERDLLKSDIPIGDCPEFNKYLVLVDENRRNSCVMLAKQQKDAIQKRRAELTEAREKKRQKLAAAMKKIREDNERLMYEPLKSATGCGKIALIYGLIAVSLSAMLLLLGGDGVIAVINGLFGVAGLVLHVLDKRTRKVEIKKENEARMRKIAENEQKLEQMRQEIQNL